MSELNFLDTGGNKQKINTPAVNSIAFNTANTERVRIDSSGRVLIGSTDGATYSDAAMDDLIIGSTANGKNDGLTILSGTAQNGSIAFADSGGSSRGLVGYVHNGDYLRFNTAGSERLRIDSSGNITKPNQPSFHVSRRGGDVSGNNYVVFDQVHHNNGNHYSTSNGRFTAPVTGVYFFSVYHFTGGSPHSAIALRINGSQYGEYHWDDTGGCATWVAPMTAGQYAQIYTVSYTFRGTSDYHNGFNGFLIG